MNRQTDLQSPKLDGFQMQIESLRAGLVKARSDLNDRQSELFDIERRQRVGQAAKQPHNAALEKQRQSAIGAMAGARKRVNNLEAKLRVYEPRLAALQPPTSTTSLGIDPAFHVQTRPPASLHPAVLHPPAAPQPSYLHGPPFDLSYPLDSLQPSAGGGGGGRPSSGHVSLAQLQADVEFWKQEVATQQDLQSLIANASMEEPSRGGAGFKVSDTLTTNAQRHLREAEARLHQFQNTSQTGAPSGKPPAIRWTRTLRPAQWSTAGGGGEGRDVDASHNEIEQLESKIANVRSFIYNREQSIARQAAGIEALPKAKTVDQRKRRDTMTRKKNDGARYLKRKRNELAQLEAELARAQQGLAGLGEGVFE